MCHKQLRTVFSAANALDNNITSGGRGPRRPSRHNGIEAGRMGQGEQTPSATYSLPAAAHEAI